ncbi:molybdenum cofactor guanylyltransferase [Schaalia sp. ZJ1691]|uniref:molybdenum cofactor guanylyltransferase n=1 Tax=Schaalia sp. ZJ1691 TaxID=2709404 RepID=UPI0013EDB557|nr:molybdenum cofactor guanylyltransferase [Schaalia sp. ZJ1691]
MYERTTHAIVLAGGKGQRLGGCLKATLTIGDSTLGDRVISVLNPLVSGDIIIVAPESVPAPTGTQRVMESPPGGGPMAGLAAGIRRVEATGDDDLVFVVAVDTPGIIRTAKPLVEAARAAVDRGFDGVTAQGSADFIQHLHACYRLKSLAEVIDASPNTHHRSVKKVLAPLNLRALTVADADCRDVDTPEDLHYWRVSL